MCLCTVAYLYLKLSCKVNVDTQYEAVFKVMPPWKTQIPAGCLTKVGWCAFEINIPF